MRAPPRGGGRADWQAAGGRLNFTDTDVRDWVGATAFSKAIALAPAMLDVLVGEAAREGDLLAHGRTHCERAYDVTLFRRGGKFSSSCRCAEQRDCVHGAALALAVRRQAAPAAGEPAGWEARLAAWLAPAPAPAPGGGSATFTYRLRWPAGPDGQPELQLQVGAAGSFAVGGLAWHLYRPDLEWAEADRHVEPAIRRIRARTPVFRDGESRTAVSWLVVPPEAYDDLLPRLAIHPRVEDDRRRPLVIHPNVALRAGLAYQGELELLPVLLGPHGRVERAQATLLGPAGARWVASQGELYRVAPAAEATWADQAPIRIPAADRKAFLGRVLPQLAEAGLLVGAPGPTELADGKPLPQLVLVEAGEDLVVRPGFLYGDERVEADTAGTIASQADGALVRRDPAAEAEWLMGLAQVLPIRRLSGEAALSFLVDHAPALVAAGWQLIGREDLRAYRLTTSVPAMRLSITRGADWFDVRNEVILGARAVAWPALQAALNRGARHVRLGDGTWAPLPAAWLEARQRLRERLGEPGPDGVTRIPCHQAPVLSQLVDEHPDAVIDEGFREFRRRMESFGGIAPAPVPAGFNGTLRPYQQQGLDFLVFLRDHGLHGILADDMGLGKTVQAAALLASGGGPSLIVAPTSVVGNWEAELWRFAPGLRVLVLHGPGRDLARVAEHDVVITSYATARQDLEAHKAITYDTVILDEAQAIKNARSQTARAMRQLRAQHRLCLTGTPVENDVQDLWSLFAFLMPGMLGGVDAFRVKYANPIALGERGPREALKARVAPFILRRLKSQVATDLPPRTDVVLRCELTPGQRRAYEAVLTGVRERIQRSVAEQGLERSRITILDALLRLRQACCHPALLGTPETARLGSGKLEAALGLIQELIAGGHRALLFSQFTSMLGILRERLDQLGIPYEYLDGGTQDRQARVDRFNGGSTPLFLISLKAGGSGLNLTGADYVIHYDPWWNPASEDQATDRAHRIGQTRHVFNYKLVATDTIEEKLVALQAEKRGLALDLLSTDASGKLVTAADLEALFGPLERMTP